MNSIGKDATSRSPDESSLSCFVWEVIYPNESVEAPPINFLICPFCNSEVNLDNFNFLSSFMTNKIKFRLLYKVFGIPFCDYYKNHLFN